jgi:hypothetical protein
MTIKQAATDTEIGAVRRQLPGKVDRRIQIGTKPGEILLKSYGEDGF